MAIIHDIGRTPYDHAYVMVQDAEGMTRVLLGTDEMLEEFARDLLDFIGRDYCLPYVCDHLEDRQS